VRNSTSSSIDRSPAAECFRMQVEIRNPLDAPLRVTDISLQAEYAQPDETTRTEKKIITPQEIPDVLLPPRATRSLIITMTASSVGRLELKGIRYRFHGLMWQLDKLSSPGKRLHAEKKHRIGKHYSEDRILSMRVLEAVSRVQATIVNDRVRTMQGAYGLCVVRVLNTGTLPLVGVNVISDHRHAFIAPQDWRVFKGGSTEQRYRPIGTFDFPSGQLAPGNHHDLELECCLLQAGEFRIGVGISGNDTVRAIVADDTAVSELKFLVDRTAKSARSTTSN
jgi:hypothetical protein